MGTTGAGKTTIGGMLAAQLNWQLADADTFHPPANIEKMSRGIPLNDTNRAPWLAAMRKAILEWIAAGKNVVLACSALKRAVGFSDEVQQEDIGLCENVQRGLRSSTYDRGRYSVKRENGVHHFHMLLGEFLGQV